MSDARQVMRDSTLRCQTYYRVQARAAFSARGAAGYARGLDGVRRTTAHKRGRHLVSDARWGMSVGLAVSDVLSRISVDGVWQK
ncbi:MAG: hypothetical protein LBI40_04090 [Treponema sp.]|nr:hypothetical protein [Treponema sp.]